MGIYDDIRGDTLTGERHILLSVLNTTSTLLTMSTSKFVSNLWNSNRADLNSHKNRLINLSQTGLLFFFLVGSKASLMSDSMKLPEGGDLRRLPWFTFYKQQFEKATLTLILQNLYPSWLRVTIT